MKAVNDILFSVEPAFIKLNFTTEKELVDPIIIYLRDQSYPSLRLHAIEVIKTLGFKATIFIHELISIFLSFTTITNADLTALKQVPYLVNAHNP